MDRYGAIVTAKGGTILVPAVTTGAGVTYAKVRCAAGHEWIPRVANLVYCNSWCPECCDNSPDKIEDLHAWGLELGGRCLSKEYAGSARLYQWECGQCQHRWKAAWNNVKHHNSWCPECKTSVREKITRAAFQENFPGENFAKDQKAIGMELDGYSEELCLAFEHDGAQHRVRVKHFQRGERDFEAQLERDARKDALCDEAGITLIRIPDRGILPHNQIRTHVRDKIIELGYDVPEALPDDATFFASVRAARGESPYLDEVKRAVAARGGTLQGDGCPTRTYPLHVRCRVGHEFETRYDSLSRGRWCPSCGGTAAKEDQEIEAAVATRDYVYLHTETRKVSGKVRRYVTAQCPDPEHPPTELLWDNFKKGRGCQKCGHKRAGAARRAGRDQVAARLERLGLAPVGPCQAINKPGVFECAEGHRFTSTVKKAEAATAATRCPACAIANLEGISLAGEYGPETDPVKTQLTWRCDQCQETFQTTYRGMRIRKKYCRNPKCG